MSEADDMFKELGYEKEEVNDKVTGTILMYNKKLTRISFFKDKAKKMNDESSSSETVCEKVDLSKKMSF